MTKQELTQEINRHEKTIIACCEERDRLKSVLHEIECNDENIRLQEFRDSIEKNGFESIKAMDMDQQFDYIDDVANALNLKTCIYSAFDHDLDEIAYEGKCTLFHEGWEDEEYTEIAENPTWLDIWKFADIAIHKVDDGHHVFLEDVFTGKFANFIHISMGS